MNRFLAALLALAILPAGALASGFQLREQDPAAQGAAFAGVAAGTGDLSAIFFNPAASALVSGNRFEAGGSFISPGTKLRDGAATRFAGSVISGASTHADAALDALLPSIYMSHELPSGIHLGLSVTAPYGLTTKYDPSWIGRYHAVTSKLKTINVSPSVSYQATPTLAIGGGLQIEQAKAVLTNMADFGTLIGFPGAADGFGKLSGDDTGYGLSAGLTWQASPDTRIGASWRSRVSHKLKGNATFSGVPAVPALLAVFANTSATAKLATPTTYNFGITHAITPEWSVMGEADYTVWSSFKELRVDFANPLKSDSVTQENWKDVWFLSLGTQYKASDKLTLRAGVAYDKSPVPDADRTPRIPDADRKWISMGAGYKLTDNVSLDGAFTHIFVDNGNLSLTDLGPGTSNYLRGNLSGTFKSEIDIVSVRLSVKF